MALKPTIYKFRIALSDMDRNLFDTLNLTVAQHPSETLERMMVRVLAFCINYRADLEFTKGLSDIEEPDLWVRDYDENVPLWIEVGEPDPDRVKKATRLAQDVIVYSFNSKSQTWWQQSLNKLTRLPASYFQLRWDKVQELASRVERSMDMTITISEQTAFFSTSAGDCEVTWTELKAND